jgi:hypothetical protein
MRARAFAAATILAVLYARQARAQEAPEVVVRAARPTRDATDMGITGAQARAVTGTENDPIKVVENLPGLARPTFGSGQLIVWGSAPGDTRTYVDGVEIPALFHGSALRSTINGDLVRRITLTPGAYGAEYGRSLGGLLRVETNDLPSTGIHGYVGADTLDGSGMVTAAPSDRVRIGLAGRYGWLDSVLKTVDARDVGDYFAIPRYRDYQAKVEVSLREGESLDAVALGSGDDVSRAIPDIDPARARSETTSSSFQRVYLRYRRVLDDGDSVDVVPYVGHDASDLDQRFGENPAILDVSTWRWGVRATHRQRVSSTVRLALGADADGSHSRITRDGSLTIAAREGDITVFGQPPGGDYTTDTWRASVVDVAPFATLDMTAGALTVSPGVRIDAMLLEASRQTPRVGSTPSIGLSHLEGALEPRLSARYKVTPNFAAIAATGIYHQPPSPIDMTAVFGTPTLDPESAQHGSLGGSLKVTKTLSAEMTGFYKWMSDLAVRDPSPTPQLAHTLVQSGVGRSYGVQLLVRQDPWEGFSGWVAYTISRSERRDTPDGTFRLFDNDQPHVLTVVANKAIGPWSLGLRFRFASGLPRTPVIGALYDLKDDVYQPIFGAQNSIRLPAFWQLDLRLDRSFTFNEKARLLVYLEGLNVTAHANQEEIVYNTDFKRQGYVTGLPAIAVLGARLEL